ncbi:MAG: hypothetical protein HWN51_05305 [Desulfobacterales bacterium]|nr:hypothetical protein [Desulfobacterales bacterium]
MSPKKCPECGKEMIRYVDVDPEGKEIIKYVCRDPLCGLRKKKRKKE